MHFCFAYGPDSYIEFRLFLAYGVLCQYAGVCFGLGGHWREELPQYANSADTQQYRYTAPTHPDCDSPGNMGLAFADTSFLDWVGFLRRKVLKLSSLLQHQGAARWRRKKLKHTRTTAKSMPCSRLFAITRTWSLQLPLYAGGPCQKYRESTTVQQYKYLARHVMPPVWGSKPQFRPALGPYRTVVWFRLARPFLIEIQERFLFCVHR